MVEPRDVSVVVQGPYTPNLTPRCVESIRHALPEAQIILSVWEGNEVPDAVAGQADLILFNPDPGPIVTAGILSERIRAMVSDTHANLNRQIVSTRNGLLRADRPYALKMRVDMAMEHTGFIDAFERFRGLPGPHRIFEERIVATNARAPMRSYAMFVQDFCFFGTTADMLRLWDIPLVPDHATLAAMPPAERDALLLVPEQYILVSALRKSLPFAMADALETTPELVRFTEAFFAGNLVCLDVPRFGLGANKKSLEWVNESPKMRHTYQWLLRASYAEFLGWCREHAGLETAPFAASAGADHEQDAAEVAIKNRMVAPGGYIDANAFLFRSVELLKQGRPHETFNALSMLVKANTVSADVYYLLGLALKELGHPGHAETHVRHALTLNPEHYPSLQYLKGQEVSLP